MKKSTMVVLIMALSITACISGCGKQEEIVNAATLEEQTLTSEPTEEESVVVTEEETESIEETTTDDDNLGVDGEFADGEYNELDEKETDVSVDETANTNETDNDVTAKIAADLGLKTTIVDGEICIDLGGDDDVYVPPTGGDTTPLPPELGPNGSGNDDQGPEFGSNPNAPKGHHIQ